MSNSTRDLIAVLKRQGFTVTPSGSTRCKVTGPSGDTVVIPAPGRRLAARALQNARTALRRIGADV